MYHPPWSGDGSPNPAKIFAVTNSPFLNSNSLKKGFSSSPINIFSPLLSRLTPFNFMLRPFSKLKLSAFSISSFKEDIKLVELNSLPTSSFNSVTRI